MKDSPDVFNLLHELEYILGQQCYNGNIQNYGSWGNWEGEGRSFRYPVRYRDQNYNDKKYSGKMPVYWDQDLKKRVESCLSDEEMTEAHYAFGANNLYVFQGLRKILNYLENRYSISFSELENNFRSPGKD